MASRVASLREEEGAMEPHPSHVPLHLLRHGAPCPTPHARAPHAHTRPWALAARRGSQRATQLAECGIQDGRAEGLGLASKQGMMHAMLKRVLHLTQGQMILSGVIVESFAEHWVYAP